MKIESIYSFIFTLFQPTKLKLNKFFPWLPPSFSSVELSSRVKILSFLTFSVLAIYKIKQVVAPTLNQPTPPPPTPPEEQPAESPSAESPVSAPVELEKEAVNEEEVAKNLKYLQAIFAQKKIPEKYKKPIDDFLDQLVREVKEIGLPDFNSGLILMSTFDTIRKDPNLKANNPNLFEILKNIIFCELQCAFKAYFLKSTDIDLLTDTNTCVLTKDGKNLSRTEYTEEEKVKLAKEIKARADAYPPHHLMKLCQFFIQLKSFQDAADLYVLGIKRMEQDCALYSKYPKIFKDDLVKIYRDGVFRLTDKLKHEDRKTWNKALTEAKKKKIPDSCNHDFRWRIFSELITELKKKILKDTPFTFEGETFNKLCDRALVLQSFCLQDFAADPRFQSLD